MGGREASREGAEPFGVGDGGLRLWRRKEMGRIKGYF